MFNHPSRSEFSFHVQMFLSYLFILFLWWNLDKAVEIMESIVK